MKFDLVHLQATKQPDGSYRYQSLIQKHSESSALAKTKVFQNEAEFFDIPGLGELFKSVLHHIQSNDGYLLSSNHLDLTEEQASALGWTS
jgi:hypothetical protein